MVRLDVLLLDLPGMCGGARGGIFSVVEELSGLLLSDGDEGGRGHEASEDGTGRGPARGAGSERTPTNAD